MTQDIPLDFFILFSSATTLFGNPGQANYVAANSWLENLALKRRANGLAATCIRWGAIEDAGYLARNKEIKEALQSRMGGKALSSSTALDILEQFLITDRSGSGVLEFDWKALNRSLPTADSPKFSELASSCADGASHEQDSIHDIHLMLSQLPEPELLELFNELLKQEIGEILRLSPDKIDSNRPIHEMGLDSLMGVELAIAVEARFGIRIPVMELRADSTVAMLVSFIISQLKEQTGIDPSENRTAQIHHMAKQHGVKIDEEDAALLASEDLTGKGTSTQ
jgi:acyl carrier protein